MGSSIFSRKRDLLYLIHFSINLPMMFRTYTLPSPSSYLFIRRVKTREPEKKTRSELTHEAVVDMQALYPPSIVPTFALNIKKWYIEAYHDDFFVHTPAWFTLFIISEVVYQVPVMIWAIGALLRSAFFPLSFLFFLFAKPATRSFVYYCNMFLIDVGIDSPRVPVVLLPFACLYFISTAVCIVEYVNWDVPLQQKIDLTTLYGPYLAIGELATPLSCICFCCYSC